MDYFLPAPSWYPPPSEDILEVGLLVPLGGTAGLFGPSCELCAQLASEEINARGGILDREVRLHPIDASGPPCQVASKVDQLVTGGLLNAVVGWHLSSLREAVAPVASGRVPYVYTALYEGGRQLPGVFSVGETPERQLLPAFRWMSETAGVRRWAIVGNDYIWPRHTAAKSREFLRDFGSQVAGQSFVPLGTTDFGAVIDDLQVLRPDAVLMLLVGEDGAHFNRAFAARGLDERCLRLSTLLDENVLLASGSENTRGVTATAAFFEGLGTRESRDFVRRYQARFGAYAPTVTSIGESCFEGLLLLEALANQHRTVDGATLATHQANATYVGPRGVTRMDDRQALQPIYLATATDMQYSVLTEL